MTYYRFLPDEKRDYFCGYTAVKNELFTPRERDTKVRYLGDCDFEKVDISRARTYWSFGRRFEIGEANV